MGLGCGMVTRTIVYSKAYPCTSLTNVDDIGKYCSWLAPLIQFLDDASISIHLVCTRNRVNLSLVRARIWH